MLSVMSVRVVVKTEEYGPLISPARDKNEPIYNWHAFKHSYSKNLVGKLVTLFKLKKGSWVLDPFCGGGTTLLACKEMGIHARGIDILPFSAFLSNVKSKTYDSSKLKRHLKEFKVRLSSSRGKNHGSLPDIGIVDKAFPVPVKKELLFLRKRIGEIADKQSRDFFMLALLSILESVSNTLKSGGFLRLRSRPPLSSSEVRFQFLVRVETMIQDVEIFNKAVLPKTKINATVGDARKFNAGRKFDAIITSPPYPNRHDYTRIYGLEMTLHFVKDNPELKKIRYKTLRSHVEARKRYPALGYKEPPALNQIITHIRKAGLNNSQVPQMIKGYFEDMFLVLDQMHKHLKKGGKIALVVSNVRFGGINLPVDTLLASIGEQVGLSAESVLVARYRGNSAQQMSKFKRNPSRESIIVWKKP